MGKKRAPEPEVPDELDVSRRTEVLGGLVLLVAFTGLLGLTVFDPAAPDRGAELLGPIGLSLVSGLVHGLGVIGFVGVGALVGATGFQLLVRGRLPRPASAGLALLGLVGAALLADLALGDRGLLGEPPAGLFGRGLATLTAGTIGTLGASMLALACLWTSALGLGRFSAAALVTDTLAGLRRHGLAALEAVRTWRLARATEAERASELEAEALEKRKGRELARLEKEAALRDKLEEKKRLAVLKARAKAEEKVLAKRAAESARAALEPPAESALPLPALPGPALDPELSFLLALESPSAAAKVEAPDAETPVVAPEPIHAPSPGPGRAAPTAVMRKLVEAPPAIVTSDRPGVAPSDEEDEVEATWVRPSERPGEADERDADDEAVAGDQPADDPAGDDADEDAIAEPWSLAGSAERAVAPEIIEARPDGPRRELLEGDAEPDEAPAKVKLDYQLPPLKLLDYDAPARDPIDEELLRSRATRLEEKLRTYGVDGRVVAIRPGPVVTTYEYAPAPGVKVSKIASLSDDIAMSMEAQRVRIIAPIPGKGVVGIELPNERRETVYLKEIIAHDRFQKAKSLLSIAVGKDTEGETQVRDLAKMPHLLVAGTTGSGKSVSVNTMILSILYKATPDQVKFIMVDPKMLELSLYNDIPHLLLPVVTDPKKASLALQWAVNEMERRYKLLSDYKVRNIEGFNKKLERLKEQREDGADAPEGHEHIEDPAPDGPLPEAMPLIVVLIDEFADLMCVAPRDVENSVQRLAQKARAAGIHVLLATQRPSTDVITGVIKNNFPSRMSFQVASRHDSMTVINQPGAESLLGMGDMLSLSNTSPNPVRIHGAFVSETEVERVVEFWKAQARPTYDDTILRSAEGDGEDEVDESEKDAMYEQAVKIVAETRKASISAIQRRLRVGYNRAARMIELMEKEGIVGPAMGPKGEREVLISAMGADGPPRT